MASELEVGKLGVGDITVKDGSDIHLVNTHSNNGADLVFGQLTFGDSSTGQYVNHARIESVGQYANSTDLRFHTSNNDSSPERMRISSTGQVGIGKSPDTTFEVAASPAHARITGNSGTSPELQLSSAGAVNWKLRSNVSSSDFRITKDSSDYLTP